MEDGVEDSVLAYARKLCDEDAGYRVKELLEILHGDGVYGGVEKQKLHQLVMAVFVRNRGLQRIIE